MNDTTPTANISRILDWARWRFADKDALIFEERRWTYTELDAEVNAAAAGLQGHGIGLGSRMAVLAMNLPEFLILAMALAKLGAVIVPLNYRLHEKELRYLVEHAGVDAIAGEPAFAEVAERLAQQAPGIGLCLALEPVGHPGWIDFRSLVSEHQGARVPDAELPAGALARILYTSGTTSRPKGVKITHGNILANMNAHAVDLPLTAADITLNASPLYHVAGLDIPGFTIWYVGGTMVLMRRFDAETFLATMARHRVTGTCIGATVSHMIRNLPSRGDHDLSCVRWLVFGQIAPKVQDDLGELFVNARLVESYGMTEACNGVSALDAAHRGIKVGSVGRPHHFVDIEVVGEDDATLPPGAQGEIVVRGPKVSPGYLDDPEATARAFRGGWFHTGDLGYMDADGYLYIRDRLKDMIRSGSENMASSEIEAVVYEFPAVAEAAVIGLPHPKWVEVPVVFAVARTGHTIDPEALITFCRGRLGRFKVPKAVFLLDALPRNPSGKVLKRDLRELAPSRTPVWAADPGAAAAGAASASVATAAPGS